MGCKTDWRRWLATAAMTAAATAATAADSFMSVPALPQMQGLPGLAPATGPAAVEANTPQARIDQQRQINDRLRLTLQALDRSLARFRATPYWDGRRDVCLNDGYSFDRSTGAVHACGGTNCTTSFQNSTDGASTCDPSRRGRPLCNTSSWCQAGYTCELSRAPGVCIPSNCTADWNRDDCQPRADRVRKGAWQ